MSLTTGINYDTGTEVVAGRQSRPHFDPADVAEDLSAIREELRCTAVRITGADLDRLRVTSELAIEKGLQVWLSPALHDTPQPRALAFLAEAAALADSLPARAETVLVVGWESSAFVPGMLRGRTTFDRMRTLSSIPRLMLSTALKGSYNANLNRFLARAADVARSRFSGPLTYASGLWEDVDWAPFDIVGVDAYRSDANERTFTEQIDSYLRHGKPVAALEFGCCTYTGAAGKGATGWTVADPVNRTIRPDAVRDEGEQATYLEEVFAALVTAGVSATFPFTFANFSYPTITGGPDLDPASYGIVRLSEPTPDGGPRWAAKEAFHRLAHLHDGATQHDLT